MFQFLDGFLTLQVKCAEYCLNLNKENKTRERLTSASLSETEKNCVMKQVKASDSNKTEVTVFENIDRIKNSKLDYRKLMYEVKLNVSVGHKPSNKDEFTLLNGCDKSVTENMDCNSESDGSSIHEGDTVFDIVAVDKTPPLFPDDIHSGYKKVQIEDTVFFLPKEGSDVDQPGLKSLPESVIMDGLNKFVKDLSKIYGETKKMPSNEEELSQVSGNTDILDKSSKL